MQYFSKDFLPTATVLEQCKPSPLTVLTSDSSPYHIWTVLFHSVKDNYIASISLGPP